MTQRITTIFNACIRYNYFPLAWKKADVITIPKKGKLTSNVTNLRPISLLSSLGKVFERILLEELKQHLQDNNAIPTSQFGFRQRLCATSQAVHLDILARQKRTATHQSLVALVDLEKAFDSVWRDAIIYKTIRFNVPAWIIRIIQSFLTDRTFRVKRNSLHSTWRIAAEGVPQGSTLSPLLFNVAVADPPDLYGRNCSLHQFADDIALLSRGYRNYNTEKLEISLERIESWLRKWRLQTNPMKTEIINLGRRGVTNEYVKFRNTHLKVKDHATYLGIVFQRRFRNRPRWTRHCRQRRTIARLTFSKLYPLMGNSCRLDVWNKVRLVNAVLTPQLLYGCEVWANENSQAIRQLESSRNRFLRAAVDAYRYTTNAEIHQRLNVRKLKETASDRRINLLQRLATHTDPGVRAIASYDTTMIV